MAEVVISNASLSVGMVTSSVTSLHMASCSVQVTRLHGIVGILDVFAYLLMFI